MPYIVDDGETIGDSETIVAHVVAKYRPAIDAALTAAQRDTDLLITRMLDDLYWVMSYSRWKDERYWPAFRDALMREHPSVSEAGLLKAREFNFQRYHFQGIGRYAPEAAYARGLADLAVLAHLIPADGYVHGPKPTGIDAGIYGFIANILFYDIETPLKQFVVAHGNLVRHCRAIHEADDAASGGFAPARGARRAACPPALRSAALMRSCQPGAGPPGKNRAHRGRCAATPCLFHTAG